MKTFEEFKKEMHEKAVEHTNRLRVKESTAFEVMGRSMKAGSLKIAGVEFIAVDRKKKYLDEKFFYVYDTEKKCFIKATVTTRSTKPHKRQPKNPITLDNYEFYDSTPGLKGIHKKPASYIVTGCSQASESAGVIIRGRTFTDGQYERAKKLVLGGMDFFEAADQVGAA